VEFVFILWLLYGAQCLYWLPAQGVSFVRLLDRWLTTLGPGFGALHPLPSGRALRASCFPLIEREGRLLSPVAVTWWSSQKTTAREREISLADLATAQASAEIVRVAGRPLARLASRSEARALADSLRRLAVAPAEQRRQCVQGLLRERLDHRAYAVRAQSVRDSTRWLGRLADAYAGVAILFVPAGMLMFGAERTLFVAWPVLAVLHLAVLTSLARAYRLVLPDERGERREALFASALYPPLLMRAHHDLVTRSLGSFHPAAVAAIALPAHERDRILRRELLDARAAAEPQASAALDLANLELAALRDLAESVGAPEASLLVMPERADPGSVAYCPRCHDEYRRTVGVCTGCGVVLAAFDA
jgi:hypothetical protein